MDGLLRVTCEIGLRKRSTHSFANPSCCLLPLFHAQMGSSICTYIMYRIVYIIYIIIYMMYIYLFYPRFVGLSLLWFLSAITCGFCPAEENSADEAAHKAVTFDLLCRSQQSRPKAPFDVIQKITFNCWVLIQCFCDIDRMQIKRHLFSRNTKANRASSRRNPVNLSLQPSLHLYKAFFGDGTNKTQ